MELFIDEPIRTPDTDKTDQKHLAIPWFLGEDAKSSAGSFKPGLFYIGIK